MAAYYNEIDEFAAAWLRNLIAAGHIAPGEVDTRSIEDVHPDDLRGFTQCHFFAGIGVWSYALRRAGIPDDRPVWTGSCPCQPFSAAGEGKGFADERHLWPAFYHLIQQRRPSLIFGEQVASKDGYAWLDLVQADLEALGDAFGAVVLPAAGFGAPHGRHRTFFVSLAHPNVTRPQGRIGVSERAAERALGPRSVAGELADADMPGEHERTSGGQQPLCDFRHFGAVRGFWANADWIPCRGGKWRPIEPGTFPLAHGAPARMGRLRGYGNAINAEVATAFIEAVDWSIGGDLA